MFAEVLAGYPGPFLSDLPPQHRRYAAAEHCIVVNMTGNDDHYGHVWALHSCTNNQYSTVVQYGAHGMTTQSIFIDNDVLALQEHVQSWLDNCPLPEVRRAQMRKNMKHATVGAKAQWRHHHLFDFSPRNRSRVAADLLTIRGCNLGRAERVAAWKKTLTVGNTMERVVEATSHVDGRLHYRVATSLFRRAHDRFLRALGLFAGTWKRPIWNNEAWAQKDWMHCAHVSTVAPGMVAYYESAEKMARGILTRVKPGRYLQKIYGSMLTADAIKAWSERYTAYTAPRVLRFVENTDPDGWEWVYEHGVGFSSCMVYKREGRYLDYDLHGKNHPVRAYARPGNGLRLAYVGDPAGTENGAVYARCIVRDDESDKGFVRVYGDDSIRHLLTAAGYVGDVDLYGVELNRRDHNGAIICPYLDSGDVKVHNDYLLVVVDGYEGQSTGLLDCDDHCDDDGDDDDDSWTCPHCGHTHDDNHDSMSTWDGLVFCPHCEDQFVSGVYNSHGNTDYMSRNEAICVADEWYRDTKVVLEANEIFRCTETGNWHRLCDMVHTSQGLVHEEDCDLVELHILDPESNSWALSWDTKEAVINDGSVVTIHKNTPYSEDLRDPEDVSDEDVPEAPVTSLAADELRV